MKKLLLILIMIFALSFAFACSEDKEDDNKQNENNQQEEINEFTVKFIADGTETVQTVKEGEKAVKPADPVKEGYIFLGWYVGETEYAFDAVNADVTVTAKFEEIKVEVKEFTVKLVVDGEVSEVKVVEGEKASKPADPVKEGYVFLGWYVGSEAYDFENAVTSDLEVQAKFEKKKSYKVTFVVDENETKVEIFEGEVPNKPADPEKEGFTFVGWFIGDEEYLFVPVTEDVVITAKFEIVFEEEFIDLDFYINGEFYKSLSLMAGETINNLDMYRAEKYGYEFVGWYFGDILLSNGYMPTKSGKVEARFEPLGTIYTVTIDGEVKEFLEGDVYELPKKFKSGHTLIGYAKDDNYVITGTIELYDNYNLTTVWKENGDSNNSYTVYLSEVDNLTSPYGGTVKLPAAYKYGYEFLGWFDGKYYYEKGFSYMVVNDSVLKAEYKKYEAGDNYSNVAFTICNLDMFYETIQFPLKEDIELPTYDETTGATISWTSENSSILTSDGKITRIMHKDRNIEVCLTALVTCGESKEAKEYIFTVKQVYKSLDNGIAAGYLYPANGISDLGLETLDIIYGAFLHFGPSGEITDGESYAKNLTNFLSRAHEKGVRVVVSIGAQGTNTIQYIKKISESAALIETFAENLLQYVIDTKLDGIDMDWETPGSSHATYYTKLMKVIYEKFKAYDEELLVTSAIGAGPWQYKYYDLKNSAKYHDYINMMSYDLQSSEKSSYQNALYASSSNYLLTSECCIDGTVKLYNSVGIPNEKIIIGIPFYGRTFSGSTGPGSKASATGAITQSAIHTYKQQYGSSIEFWDDECKVPYIYIAQNGTFVSYDNPRSIAEKMKYVGEKGLAGIMYWQNGQDYNSILMTAISENYQYMK